MSQQVQGPGLDVDRFAGPPELVPSHVQLVLTEVIPVPSTFAAYNSRLSAYTWTSNRYAAIELATDTWPTWAAHVNIANRPAGSPSIALYHPTSPYKSLWDVGAMALLLLLERRQHQQPRHGGLFAGYMLAYIVGRSTTYTIRLLDRRPQQLERRMGHRARVVSALAGFRGAVSPALTLAVPYTVEPSSMNTSHRTPTAPRRGGSTRAGSQSASSPRSSWTWRGGWTAVGCSPGAVRLVSRSGDAVAWERPPFTAAESKWAPAVPSYLRLLQAYHADMTSQMEQDDGLGLEIHR
ncbi:prolipoprotein diacylglyceryl transferase family protein [Streptomyces sp. NPDC048385]|uniref:prolipoprotein diacylglyceryl transferase family protein n=1 Tax=unclassified Streptomyces TaxID=2593676 RepID=UPI003418EDEA